MESCPINTALKWIGNVSGYISAIWTIRAAPLLCSSPCSRLTRLRPVTERLDTTLEPRTFHQLSHFWPLVCKDSCNMEIICIIPPLTKQSTEACPSAQLNLTSSSLITNLEQLATGLNSVVQPNHILLPLNSLPRWIKTKTKRITKLLWKYSCLQRTVQKHTLTWFMGTSSQVKMNPIFRFILEKKRSFSSHISHIRFWELRRNTLSRKIHICRPLSW